MRRPREDPPWARIGPRIVPAAAACPARATARAPGSAGRHMNCASVRCPRSRGEGRSGPPRLARGRAPDATRARAPQGPQRPRRRAGTRGLPHRPGWPAQPGEGAGVAAGSEGSASPQHHRRTPAQPATTHRARPLCGGVSLQPVDFGVAKGAFLRKFAETEHESLQGFARAARVTHRRRRCRTRAGYAATERGTLTLRGLDPPQPR